MASLHDNAVDCPRIDLEDLQRALGGKHRLLLTRRGCHPKSPAWPIYDAGTDTLRLMCAECRTIFVEVALSTDPISLDEVPTFFANPFGGDPVEFRPFELCPGGFLKCRRLDGDGSVVIINAHMVADREQRQRFNDALAAFSGRH